MAMYIRKRYLREEIIHVLKNVSLVSTTLEEVFVMLEMRFKACLLNKRREINYLFLKYTRSLFLRHMDKNPIAAEMRAFLSYTNPTDGPLKKVQEDLDFAFENHKKVGWRKLDLILHKNFSKEEVNYYQEDCLVNVAFRRV